MSYYTKIIFITGTPGTGKTTIADQLNMNLSEKSIVKLVKINDFAIKNNLIDDEDLEKDYKVINILKLDKKLNEVINDFFSNEDDLKNLKIINFFNDFNYSKIVIVEGHLSHLCFLGGNVDKIIVLRLNPEILENRLKLRDYAAAKINENLESEVLGICSIEAHDIHGDKVNEIDTSGLSIENVLDVLTSVLHDEKSYPIGHIDFSNWILD